MNRLSLQPPFSLDIVNAEYINKLMLSSYVWGKIAQDVSSGIFTDFTKANALFVKEILGSHSMFINVLAGGNLEYPCDVIEAALSFSPKKRR